MGLFGRPHVSLNFCEIALDANMCLDLPVLLTCAVEHCAVTSTRKLAYGLFENVSIVKSTSLKLALSLANSGVSFAHYVRGPVPQPVLPSRLLMYSGVIVMCVGRRVVKGSEGICG